MQSVLETVLHNVDTIARVCSFPSHKLRVINEFTIVHDDRVYVQWLTRRLTGDGRDTLIQAISKTLDALKSIHVVFRDSKQESSTYREYSNVIARVNELSIDFINGIKTIAKVYDDVNTVVRLTQLIERFKSICLQK